MTIWFRLSVTQTRREPDALVDSSVAIALVTADHRAHALAMSACAGRHLGLSGHAAFESYSVLTRLPSPNRRDPTTVLRLLEANFPANRYLSDERAATVLGLLASSNIAGGSVYDALVGATASEHGLPLLSRDLRAWPTYQALGVRVEMVIAR